jgi:hypothetical protein
VAQMPPPGLGNIGVFSLVLAGSTGPEAK